MSALQRLYHFVESTTCASVISVASTRLLEQTVNALNISPRIWDLSTHGWATSLVATFAGMAIAHDEEGEHNYEHYLPYSLQATTIGVMAGTVVEQTSLSAPVAAFTAAAFALYQNMPRPAPIRFDDYTP